VFNKDLLVLVKKMLVLKFLLKQLKYLLTMWNQGPTTVYTRG